MIAFMAHLDNPTQAPPLKILNFITSLAIQNNIHPLATEGYIHRVQRLGINMPFGGPPLNPL